MGKVWAANGKIAPAWAIAFGRNPKGYHAWLGQYGYHYCDDSDGIVEYSFSLCDYQPGDFEIIERRPTETVVGDTSSSTGEWISHLGNKCPVVEGTLIDLRHQDGTLSLGVACTPSGPFWSGGDHRRIVAYRYSAPEPTRIAAHEFLERGAQHMRNRAVQRDAPDGERSMARCVAAFNAQEDTNLTEAQGWRFMIQLKYARSVHGQFTADDYEDLAAYAGLAGEAAQ